MGVCNHLHEYLWRGHEFQMYVCGVVSGDVLVSEAISQLGNIAWLLMSGSFVALFSLHTVFKEVETVKNEQWTLRNYLKRILRDFLKP